MYRGWKGVLRFIASSPRTPRSCGQVADALGITTGAAWVLLERCRLFSNLRKVREGARGYYEITKKGKALVAADFKRGHG